MDILNLRSIDSRVNQYLACESLINKFFSLVGECKEDCLNGTSCCNYNFFIGISKDVSEVFDSEREKLYGGLDFGMPCAYLSEKGCRLKSYKSPACISFACNPLIGYLMEQYNIDWNYDEIRLALEDILEGLAIQEEVDDLKSKIKNFISIDEKSKV